MLKIKTMRIRKIIKGCLKESIKTILIAEKYPNKLRLVHTEGIIEEAYVYEIFY